MPYSIKYRPRTGTLDHLPDSTASEVSAIAAAALVQQLEISDERILEIRDPSGRIVSRDQLNERAKKEAN